MMGMATRWQRRHSAVVRCDSQIGLAAVGIGMEPPPIPYPQPCSRDPNEPMTENSQVTAACDIQPSVSPPKGATIPRGFAVVSADSSPSCPARDCRRRESASAPPSA